MGSKRFNYCLIALLLTCTAAFAGERVTGIFHADGINWTGINNIGNKNINWTDVKTLDASYGSHSGINWQSFGV